MPEETQARPAVFLDRDNTLIVGADYIGDPEQVVLMEDAVECVAGLREMGFATVVISNQSGVARGYFTEKDVQAVNRRIDGLLRARDRRAIIDRHEFCPHHPTHGVAPYRQACQCRKPRDGMIRRAAAALKLDLTQSWLIGDAPRDIEAGAAAGLRTILLEAPDLEPSPAAKAPARVEPAFRVGSLREALWVIAKETGKQLPAMTAEQQEMDELQDLAPPPVAGDDDDELVDAPQEKPTMRDDWDPHARPMLEETMPGHLSAGDAPDMGFAAGRAGEGATSDRIAAATAQILDDIRRQRETPREDFNFFRLLAGVVQVLAIAALVWGVVLNFETGRLLAAVFLQVLTLTLVSASGR